MFIETTTSKDEASEFVSSLSHQECRMQITSISWETTFWIFLRQLLHSANASVLFVRHFCFSTPQAIVAAPMAIFKVQLRGFGSMESTFVAVMQHRTLVMALLVSTAK